MQLTKSGIYTIYKCSGNESPSIIVLGADSNFIYYLNSTWNKAFLVDISISYQ